MFWDLFAYTAGKARQRLLLDEAREQSSADVELKERHSTRIWALAAGWIKGALTTVRQHLRADRVEGVRSIKRYS